MDDLSKTKNKFKKNVIIGGVFLLIGVFSGGGALITGDFRWLILSAICFGMAAYTLIKLRRMMRKLIADTLKEVEDNLKKGDE